MDFNKTLTAISPRESINFNTLNSNPSFPNIVTVLHCNILPKILARIAKIAKKYRRQNKSLGEKDYISDKFYWLWQDICWSD